MRNKWSVKHIIELIELFKAHPSQWDQSSRDYRLKRKKEKDLLAIAGSMGVEKTVIEKKWKSLRTIYKSELNKIAASKKAGNLYVSPWRYFGYLRFLYGNRDESEISTQEPLCSFTMEIEDSNEDETVIDDIYEAKSQRNQLIESEVDKWSDEKIIELIQHYEVHPLLWDQSDEEFKVNSRRDETLEEIAKTMGVPKEDIKKKWKSLRNQFNSELNKMRNSKSIDDLYVSHWRFLSPMQFLYEDCREETSCNEYYLVEQCENSDLEDVAIHPRFNRSENPDIGKYELEETSVSTDLKRKWSPQAVYQLIQQYKEHPSLWDRSTREYRLKNIREKDICQVAENMGVERIEIERKWKSLRTHCKAELKKMREGREAGGKRVFFSNWRFLKAMHFIYDNCKENETHCNGNSLPCESDDSENMEVKMINIQQEENECVEGENSDGIESDDVPKKIKISTNVEKDTLEHKASKTCKESYGTNECDIFCSLMATKLRKLNRNLRDEAMRQLMRVMWDFEDTQKRSSTPPPPCDSFEYII
ncbi:uncharacterized protein LOC129249095 [Anastrepha obliqua]|uniref:uncharacterized protein LOC129249095 n=1 Tax=Anastrepha obliqua TaxID=95512 RepID=UPI00240A1852|nr:uncharacterized protein LOC129249095 [Anastrepha obliqua]